MCFPVALWPGRFCFWTEPVVVPVRLALVSGPSSSVPPRKASPGFRNAPNRNLRTSPCLHTALHARRHQIRVALAPCRQ